MEIQDFAWDKAKRCGGVKPAHIRFHSKKTTHYHKYWFI
jgi:hypothetical protein